VHPSIFPEKKVRGNNDNVKMEKNKQKEEAEKN
jgi:hypothetical protein